MPFSPENRSAALLMSALEYAVKHPSAGMAVAPEIAAESREFLLAMDDDSRVEPQSEIEHGTALALNWLKAAEAGRHEDAAALIEQIERKSPAYPARAAVHALATVQGNGTDKAKGDRTDNYRRYGKDLNFGVIDWALPDDAKVAVVGDFGTGGADSAFLMESIVRYHPETAAILHLGDIYDTGVYDTEVRQHFIEPIRHAFKQANLAVPPVFAVPGDHEYFSGGGGFFEMITGEIFAPGHDGAANYKKVVDPINGTDSAMQQQASCFCLRSKSGDWQFLGADTGFTSTDISPQPGIDPDELLWHKDKVESFRGRTVFLTHRQFLSAYDQLDDGSHPSYNANLVNDMKDLLSLRPNGQPKTSLFLWGHEHRFVPFVDGLDVPGYAKPLKTKMRLLGGSARETGSRSRLRDSFLVMTGKGGTPISTSAVNPGKIWNRRKGVNEDVIFSNHSYAIIELKTAKASYFEVTAWDQSTPRPFIQLTSPPPLVVDDL